MISKCELGIAILVCIFDRERRMIEQRIDRLTFCAACLCIDSVQLQIVISETAEFSTRIHFANILSNFYGCLVHIISDHVNRTIMSEVLMSFESCFAARSPPAFRQDVWQPGKYRGFNRFSQLTSGECPSLAVLSRLTAVFSRIASQPA